MSISAIQALQAASNVQQTQAASAQTTNFTNVFAEALKNAEETASIDATGTEALLTGETNDLHTVMIQSEQADLALRLTIQVRNKVLDAYTEIMRMQI